MLQKNSSMKGNYNKKYPNVAMIYGKTLFYFFKGSYGNRVTF